MGDMRFDFDLLQNLKQQNSRKNTVVTMGLLHRWVEANRIRYEVLSTDGHVRIRLYRRGEPGNVDHRAYVDIWPSTRRWRGSWMKRSDGRRGAKSAVRALERHVQDLERWAP